ncbi:entericidin A/B family lipoprotein [Plastorhodobacter daqingensis]|uniref:Entericidin A/B family lipoprotein n=1 Tax=Plastorhodobacter daqingensis TaxID=1387281 RepID=A0ABW2UPK3_9RHOB
MLYRLFPVLVILGLAACNTVEGAGQDISAAGTAITSEARQAQ